MINPERIDHSTSPVSQEFDQSQLDSIISSITAFQNKDQQEIIYDTIVDSTIGRYDSNTAAHCLNTGQEAKQFGSFLLDNSNFKYKDEIDVSKLEIAGMLHDIGKIYIPQEILNSKEKLTDDEFLIIKKHPLFSYEILKKMPVNEDILTAVLDHHEKIDGSGYPNHLKENEIPILAQIIAVTDVYDALTSKRPYREELTPDKALDLMQTFDGHFNQDIFNFFIESKKTLISPIPILRGNGQTPILPA